jgi:hypothetical protein
LKVTETLLPLLKKSTGKTIVNIASEAGIIIIIITITIIIIIIIIIIIRPSAYSEVTSY